MMSRDSNEFLGVIDLLDLHIACESYGLESAPFPFRFTKPVGSIDDAYTREVPDRFRTGDLSVFREWAASYVFADIRVECHGQSLAGPDAHLRVLATRAGDLGFVARQLADRDAVEVHKVPPVEIGSSVARKVFLGNPGKHPKAAIAGYTLPKPSRVRGDYDVQDLVDATSQFIPEVPKSSVSVLGTIQSHYLPAKEWGVNPQKSAVVWLKVDDDGYYLIDREFSVAYPGTTSELTRRINREISDDIQVIRAYRKQY